MNELFPRYLYSSFPSLECSYNPVCCGMPYRVRSCHIQRQQQQQQQQQDTDETRVLLPDLPLVKGILQCSSSSFWFRNPKAPQHLASLGLRTVVTKAHLRSSSKLISEHSAPGRDRTYILIITVYSITKSETPNESAKGTTVLRHLLAETPSVELGHMHLKVHQRRMYHLQLQQNRL